MEILSLEYISIYIIKQIYTHTHTNTYCEQVITDGCQYDQDSWVNVKFHSFNVSSKAPAAYGNCFHVWACSRGSWAEGVVTGLSLWSTLGWSSNWIALHMGIYRQLVSSSTHSHIYIHAHTHTYTYIHMCEWKNSEQLNGYITTYFKYVYIYKRSHKYVKYIVRSYMYICRTMCIYVHVWLYWPHYNYTCIPCHITVSYNLRTMHHITNIQ